MKSLKKYFSSFQTQIKNWENFQNGIMIQNGIMAKRITDEPGKFKIYILPQAWDTDDGMITVNAEYHGNSKYNSSVSNPQKIIVFPLNSPNCAFVNGL